MKLIPEWRGARKMFSVRAMGAAVAVQGAWTFVPADMRASIPDFYLQIGTIIILALGIVGRLVDQGISNEDDT